MSTPFDPLAAIQRMEAIGMSRAAAEAVVAEIVAARSKLADKNNTAQSTTRPTDIAGIRTVIIQSDGTTAPIDPKLIAKNPLLAELINAKTATSTPINTPSNTGKTTPIQAGLFTTPPKAGLFTRLRAAIPSLLLAAVITLAAYEVVTKISH